MNLNDLTILLLKINKKESPVKINIGVWTYDTHYTHVESYRINQKLKKRGVNNLGTFLGSTSTNRFVGINPEIFINLNFTEVFDVFIITFIN